MNRTQKSVTLQQFHNAYNDNLYPGMFYKYCMCISPTNYKICIDLPTVN